MAGSKGRKFPFKHCHDVLKHLPKWQLRDQEGAIKKGSMKMKDDSDDEGGVKYDKPEGCAGAWLMAPEVSLCVVNDQPVGNPKRKV
jgi:hypothetical protein